ncbi:hypothetical protein [Paenibacillus tengchongensis]|uniref:hypothetical protein n=1 Tax=Paenibacillus tengchongensis TaxID=2608684 RepID=UPI00124CBD58|nr:hypothetical protein [Paenibacillus tengchongensis]
MKRRLWNGFSYFFIRTPIAALLIIAGLGGGLFVWMNSTYLQHDLTVPGIMVEEEDRMLVRVQGDYDMSEIRLQDITHWYLSADGGRYPGTIVDVEQLPEDRALDIEVSPGAWLQAKLEAGEAPSGQTVYVDLPQGRRSLWFKMIHKGGSL